MTVEDSMGGRKNLPGKRASSAVSERTAVPAPVAMIAASRTFVVCFVNCRRVGTTSLASPKRQQETRDA